ncbi:DNA-3-methyladenine glycosylase I [Aliiroseovarius crassostreae]|uniref:DNA-3-methyladenine glycosylase I n=1 Tax=Aliiroseovarius crassostreae TaxID=154981 RepID=A0A9Q9H758_9RHOB|nr:DNA-3-methyladenine glycosylase I [Aliiroseovarius crassostreae]UWP91678.1 DNA-3-methyladenine glycosylase I [Aliiroseovarius crassostreae]UWP94823.1 DNA-3-methyladenine glycosylase I [Aliiroseovarius crassostreae]
MIRCAWCGEDPLYQTYHDQEWGVPERDGRALWEKLILDGFQAGLSWITILRKRDNFRAAFAGFDPEQIATWDEEDISRLLADPGIIRHRGKIAATITNAQAYLDLGGAEAFSEMMWAYVDGRPLVGHYATQADVPTSSALSSQISKDLKKAGFKFCGPTIVYAWMEACGLFMNHTRDCHRYPDLNGQS